MVRQEKITCQRITCFLLKSEIGCGRDNRALCLLKKIKKRTENDKNTQKLSG